MKQAQNENFPMRMIREEIENKQAEMAEFKRDMRKSWSASWPAAWRKPTTVQAQKIQEMADEIAARKKQYARMAKA